MGRASRIGSEPRREAKLIHDYEIHSRPRKRITPIRGFKPKISGMITTPAAEAKRALGAHDSNRSRGAARASQASVGALERMLI